MEPESPEIESSHVNFALLDALGGHEFEDLVEQLLSKMGFHIEGRKAAADGGIDMVATKTDAIVGGKFIIQCKRFTGSVGNSARTVVIAPRLTRSEILKAMKERRVYASEDKDLQVLFKINGKRMGSINPRLTGGAFAKISVAVKDLDEPDSAYQVRIFYDPAPGGAQATQVGVISINNHAIEKTFDHTPTAGKGYYFLVVTSTQGANEGYSAWTAPIWFE